MRARTCAAVAMAAALSAGQAHAQQPAAPQAGTPASTAQPASPPSEGTPDKMPFDIPYGAPISLERGKQVLAAAEAEAQKRDWKMNIAVVDTHGELLNFVRMDGAQLASITVSQNKARTAARWRRESRVFYNAYETGHPYSGTLDPQLAASPGGFPPHRGREDHRGGRLQRRHGRPGRARLQGRGRYGQIVPRTSVRGRQMSEDMYHGLLGRAL